MRHRRLNYIIGSLFLILLCIATPGAAAAQAIADFEDLFQQGNQFAQAGRSAQALAAYKQAYIVRPEPIVLVAMGLINLQLGRYQEALKACQKYLVVEKSPASQERQAADCVAKAKEGINRAAAAKTSQLPPPQAETPEAPLLPPRIEITEPLALAPGVRPRGKDWSPEPLVLEIPEEPTPVQRPMSPPPPRLIPVYKKWWFWTVLGLATAGLATGVAVGVNLSNVNANPNPVMPADPFSGIPMPSQRQVSF